MSRRKLNEWLDAEEDDDSFESDRDSTRDQDVSRAHLATKSAKRRKVELPDDSDKGPASRDDDDRDGDYSSPKSAKQPCDQPRDDRFDETPASVEGQEGFEEDQIVSSAAPQAKDKKKSKRKSGVIYISRIPPFMKPQVLRNYLSPYGEIGKIFLTPEDHATYIRRKRSGGNKKHSFVDGWVEFLSKKDAKMVASTLNGNIMGGKKGNYYHDDIWNIKYLTGFKWDDLTEQIARENKERESRLRTEIARAKRENEAFVRDVERGKMLDTMETKRKQRGNQSSTRDDKQGGGKEERPRKMVFKQNVTINKTASHTGSDAQHGSGRILSKLL